MHNKRGGKLNEYLVLLLVYLYKKEEIRVCSLNNKITMQLL